MGIADLLLARCHVTILSELSPDECRGRIGPNTGILLPGARQSQDSPYYVIWHGDNDVTLLPPFERRFRRRGPRQSLRARLVAQPDSQGTLIDATTGLVAGRVATNAVLWAFLVAVLVANRASVLHARSAQSAIEFGFVIFAMPAFYLWSRYSTAGQAQALVSALEDAVGASPYAAPQVGLSAFPAPAPDPFAGVPPGSPWPPPGGGADTGVR